MPPEPPYGIIWNRLKAVNVVPFLGVGASFVGRPLDTKWDAYNSHFPDPMAIEDGLVHTVLSQVRTGQVIIGKSTVPVKHRLSVRPFRLKPHSYISL